MGDVEADETGYQDGQVSARAKRDFCGLVFFVLSGFFWHWVFPGRGRWDAMKTGNVKPMANNGDASIRRTERTVQDSEADCIVD